MRWLGIMRDGVRILMLTGLVAIMTIGCHSRTARPQPPTTRAVEREHAIEFSSPRDGFSLRYPSGWTPKPSNDFVMELHRGETATISMDVPSLPPHLPGMIRLSLVENGFLDDLKKETGGVHSSDRTDISVPDAQARRITTSWSKAGTEFRQSAVLMIHADRVYILRATAPADQFDATSRDLDEVLKSLTWTKRS